MQEAFVGPGQQRAVVGLGKMIQKWGQDNVVGVCRVNDIQGWTTRTLLLLLLWRGPQSGGPQRWGRSQYIAGGGYRGQKDPPRGAVQSQAAQNGGSGDGIGIHGGHANGSDGAMHNIPQSILLGTVGQGMQQPGRQITARVIVVAAHNVNVHVDNDIAAATAAIFVLLMMIVLLSQCLANAACVIRSVDVCHGTQGFR